MIVLSIYWQNYSNFANQLSIQLRALQEIDKLKYMTQRASAIADGFGAEKIVNLIYDQE